jgi:hypothetical protein
MDKQTRIGIGAAAVFVLISYVAPLLGGWAIPALLLTLLVAIWGMWPLLEPHHPAKEAIAIYWKRNAKRYGAVVAVLLIGVGIGLLANGYKYIFRSPPTFGPLAWNFEETAAGHGYFLNMQKTGNKEINVAGFGAIGKNTSSDPISDFQGYVRSVVTNETTPIYILAANSVTTHACTLAVPSLPEDTRGIPGFSLVQIVSYKKPFFVNVPYADAIPFMKFESEFVPFTVILKYGGKEYKRQFQREEVERQKAIFEKASGPPTEPYIIRKAPQVTSLPPLTPLISPRGWSPPVNPDLTGTVLEK